ncbi:hypothetical protein BH09BAC3_BH09BAC3_08730 [soil metagenome]
MRFVKDSFLDVLYSIFFGIAMVVKNPISINANAGIDHVFRNLILIVVILLWLKSLSRNHSGKLFRTSGIKSESLLTSAANLFKDFIALKIAATILGFCLYSLFSNSFEFFRIHSLLIEIFAVGFYTLSILLINKAYLSFPIDSWQLLAIALGPFFALFMVFGIFNLNSVKIFALIPCNLDLLLEQDLKSKENLLIAGFSVAISIVLIYFGIRSLEKIKRSPNHFTLPNNRVN